MTWLNFRLFNKSRTFYVTGRIKEKDDCLAYLKSVQLNVEPVTIACRRSSDGNWVTTGNSRRMPIIGPDLRGTFCKRSKFWLAIKGYRDFWDNIYNCVFTALMFSLFLTGNLLFFIVFCLRMCLQGLRKTSVRMYVCGTRFEPWNSQIRSISTHHSADKFRVLIVTIFLGSQSYRQTAQCGTQVGLRSCSNNTVYPF
jgi:hypothetical protein